MCVRYVWPICYYNKRTESSCIWSPYSDQDVYVGRPWHLYTRKYICRHKNTTRFILFDETVHTTKQDPASLLATPRTTSMYFLCVGNNSWSFVLRIGLPAVRIVTKIHQYSDYVRGSKTSFQHVLYFVTGRRAGANYYTHTIYTQRVQRTRRKYMNRGSLGQASREAGSCFVVCTVSTNRKNLVVFLWRHKYIFFIYV